ncbi:hypothetical protein QJS10_CPB11g01380 [Acorus calamus]|uniref:Uncharacterized protein n=1 Tax=Acorus calamus TaxID=4465 RepID=A0AAV9DST3_ACOCL|nr:hypothetical protein QJS10_CPB11g01380 [Acorus calamus]
MRWLMEEQPASPVNVTRTLAEVERDSMTCAQDEQEEEILPSSEESEEERRTDGRDRRRRRSKKRRIDDEEDVMMITWRKATAVMRMRGRMSSDPTTRRSVGEGTGDDDGGSANLLSIYRRRESRSPEMASGSHWRRIGEDGSEGMKRTATDLKGRVRQREVATGQGPTNLLSM